MHSIRVSLCGVGLALAGCAGDGSGLDENGRPITESAEALQPTFDSIQTNVLTPICTTCHAGAAAPLGLRLDEEAAYAMLVGAPSVEAPALLRVAPGDPDASYLIQKIEGTAAVGARMPLNGPPLGSETIAVIRQWIADGAPAPSGAGVASVQAVWPVPDAVLRQAPRELIVSANTELDASLAAAGVMTLRASGGDGVFGDANDREIEVRIDLRSLDPTVFALTVPGERWFDDQYELRVSGGAPLALADRMSRPIDGDGDGTPGGDYVVRFTVESAR